MAEAENCWVQKFSIALPILDFNEDGDQQPVRQKVMNSTLVMCLQCESSADCVRNVLMTIKTMEEMMF